jgi:O-antigen/teichoic acid export membrane protein
VPPASATDASAPAENPTTSATLPLSGLRLPVAAAFRPDHLAEDLAGKTARSGFVTAGSQTMQLIVQALGFVVLGRLLSPNDYGIVGMVAVFVGLAQVVKDGGLATGTVQSDRISHEQTSTMFWINVGILAITALAIVAASPLIASFYRKPELTPVTAVLGVAFFLNGLSVQHDALLRRHMRFRAVSLTQLVPLALSLATSIVLAVLGWRYWALVAGTVVTAVTSTALSFYFVPWLPGRVHRRSGARKLLHFGRDLTIFNAFNYFARNADNILVGKFLGSVELGLYSRAYSLFLLPMTQIRGPLADVSMPALSALKDQPERYARYYRRLLTALAFCAVPISAYCALDGGFVITALLGPRWAEAGLVFRILAAAGVVQTIASTRGLVLVTLGESRKYLWLGVVNSIAMVISFAIGLRWGIVGVAIAYGVANVVVLVPTLAFTFRGTPVTIASFFAALGRPVAFAALASLAAWAALAAATRGLGDTLWAHAAALVAFWAVYVLLASASREFRDTWQAFFGRALGTARTEPTLEGGDR